MRRVFCSTAALCVTAVFVLPMVAVLNLLLSVLVAHYRMVTFLETLPLP